MGIVRVFAFAVLFAFAGCTRVTSDVTTFNGIAGEADGKKIAFLDDGDYKTLEREHYKGFIRSKLSGLGFVETEPESADLLIAFNYGVGDGDSISTSVDVPVYGVTGYSNDLYGGTVSHHGITGTTSIPFNTTSYGRNLIVVLVDKLTKESVWEATVKSKGRCSDLNQIMPYMVDAAFKDFPGHTGLANERITVRARGLNC